MTAEPPDGVERIPPPWDPGSEALEDPGAIEAALDVEGGADELAKATTSGAEAVVGRWTSPLGRLARTTLAILAFVFIVAIVWEAFKWLFGDPWRLTDI